MIWSWQRCKAEQTATLWFTVSEYFLLQIRSLSFPSALSVVIVHLIVVSLAKKLIALALALIELLLHRLILLNPPLTFLPNHPELLVSSLVHDPVHLLVPLVLFFSTAVYALSGRLRLCFFCLGIKVCRLGRDNGRAVRFEQLRCGIRRWLRTQSERDESRLDGADADRA